MANGKWMTYSEASQYVGYTVDALRRFEREGRIRRRKSLLPFQREMLLREDVETIRMTMSGGARNWIP